jgi:hypothetical protein
MSMSVPESTKAGAVPNARRCRHAPATPTGPDSRATPPRIVRLSAIRAGWLTLEDLRVRVKFGADLEGVGVVEVLQDVQGLLPGVLGGGHVSGGPAGVAEAA